MAAERSTILVFRQSPPSADRTGGVLTCLINYTRNRNGAITIPVIFMASFFHPGISATLI